MRAPNFSFTSHSASATFCKNRSASTDPRAEELVRPHGLPALLAVDDREGRERRPARGAAAKQLTAALRAGVRDVGLEVLEPPSRCAATETERDPVPEDLPTLLPQPVRRPRHVLTLAVVVLLAVAIYIVVRDLIRGYWTCTATCTRSGSCRRSTATGRSCSSTDAAPVPRARSASRSSTRSMTSARAHRSPSSPTAETTATDTTEPTARGGRWCCARSCRGTVWIDVGTEDPFRSAAVHYAHEIHAQLHVWPGGHDDSYWHAHLRR